jgi:hypothetical protein
MTVDEFRKHLKPEHRNASADAVRKIASGSGIVLDGDDLRGTNPYADQMRSGFTPKRRGLWEKISGQNYTEENVQQVTLQSTMTAQQAAILDTARTTEKAEFIHQKDISIAEDKQRNEQTILRAATAQTTTPELFVHEKQARLESELRVDERLADADATAYNTLVAGSVQMKLLHQKQSFDLALESKRKENEIHIKEEEARAQAEAELLALRTTEKLALEQRKMVSELEQDILDDILKYQLKQEDIKKQTLPATIEASQLQYYTRLIKARERDLEALRPQPLSDTDGEAS